MNNDNFNEAEFFNNLFSEPAYGDAPTTKTEIDFSIRKHNQISPTAPIQKKPVRSLEDNSIRYHGNRIFELSDFLAMDIPERDNLLSPWLHESSLNMVFAPAGVGKTFFALNVAYAVATGGSFLGWNADKPYPVLYVDGEMSAKEMQNRLKAINGGSTVTGDIPFRLVTPELLGGSMPDLTTYKGQYLITEAAKSVKLIVLDNIACLFPSGNENETESWRSAQHWLLELRRKGIAVLLVHHSSKAGTQRGTSAKQDVLDTIISLKRPKAYSATQGAEFTVSFTKNRSFYGADAQSFTAKLTTDENNIQKWRRTDLIDISESGNSSNANYDETVRLYNEGARQADIARKLGRSAPVISRYVKRGKEEGKIVEATQPNTPSPKAPEEPTEPFDSGDSSESSSVH